MKISMIAAVAENGAIGKDNDMIWHLPDDMRFFKEKTKGHPVIMGRKNYDSLPEKWRPLPDRTNIILTRKEGYSQPGTVVFHELKEALAFAEKEADREIFIIGGGEIYTLGLEFADTMYITEVAASFPEADAFFPPFSLDLWEETERIHHLADDKHAYEFDYVTYKRKTEE